MLVITYKHLKALAPYARNARTHSAGQIAKIKASLAAFGWATPMGEADGTLIYGHGRLLAALEMAEAGIEIPGNPDPWEAPTVDLSHLSRAERQAYVLADNRIALDSGWDDELLKIELADLKEVDFNLGLTGFDLPELDRMFSLAGIGSQDLMDPTDGSGETRGESTLSLSWGKNSIPLTEEEFALMDARLAQHTAEFGTTFGFIRETLS